MDIIKIGRTNSSVHSVSTLFENDKILVERLFCENEDFVIRVTRYINTNSRAVYYMTFTDVISMFACIDFLSNPNAI